jgi:glutamate dehydrogenase
MAATVDLVRQHIGRGDAAAEAGLLERFVTALFDKAEEGFAAQFDGADLYAMAVDGLEFLRELAGVFKVEVLNPTRAANGWESPFTVVRLVMTDRPFIVDSVQAEVARQGLELAYQLHPILDVVRDERGRLVDVDGDAGGRPEAFEMFFVERVEGAALRRLRNRVKAVLHDVYRATRDYLPMQERSREAVDYLLVLARSGVQPAAGIKADEVGSDLEDELEEYAEFIRWLLDENFVYLGYREYELKDVGGEPHLQVRRGTGLGILSDDADSRYREPVAVSGLPRQLRQRVVGGRLLVVTKTNSEATVHRARRMDYVGVKELGDGGEVVGERRFLGLFTSKAQNTPVDAIPILRRKLRQVLELDEAVPGSHDYKAIVSAFNSLPREELFGADPEQLHKDIRAILSPGEERGARLRLRADPLKRGILAMVVMPRESFNSQVRQRIQEYLQRSLSATHVDYRLALSEDQDHARFHFYFATDVELEDVDVKELERNVARLSRSWREELQERLIERFGEAEGRALARRYGGAFDEGYYAEVRPARAVQDIANLERLGPGETGFDLVDDEEDREATVLVYYPAGRRRALSDVLPMLENLGLRVVDQNPYDVALDGGERAVDVYRVTDMEGRRLDVARDEERLIAALRALASGEAENDALNRLVLYAGLTIRQVALLRAYQMYYSQLNLVTSPAFVTATLLAHPDVARLLVEYFERRFDPAFAGGGDAPLAPRERAPHLAEAADAVRGALSTVASLAGDQALRGLLDLMEATVRTNYYLGHARISFKIDSRKVGSMPEPRPLYEIGVHSPTVEGTHLRGGKVARGGIRWSDRPDDFRTEVLGLMKTQMTKNAVIVPVGSKGGFVVKRAPADPAALREHVRAQYQEYIRGLLDVTDNVVDGETVHPRGVLVYDEPDPYLVVAADKGTATFSDLANATAAEYDFWLGDAFASGGSAGYDHKGMGITARGAWECVKRHFAEMGLNVFRDEFTVVGIGDMSGDVFGNGMLYTDKIRLVAAFDHRHVFVDPDPDPARSYAERRRLFELPRSSWDDYDRSLISPGGGVFERGAKRIAVTPEMKRALGIDADELSGPELIRAVLRAPVDLLWNGGIGTYVKASAERHAEVGDSANDAVRVDAGELRCKVVGEGGNLGFTQLARIEYARAGGRIDTDAIHNSAGVDTSDHEVNIKICLAPLLRAGRLSREERDALLAEMQDDVARLVLRDNDRQSQAISLALRSSASDQELFGSLLDYLVESAGLDRSVEFLPTARQLAERRAEGVTFTRPELAVMLAYVKMGLYRRLLETDLPDDPQLAHYLRDYFPAVLRERFPDAVAAHQLRREITATQITNAVVDLLGVEFVHRAVRQNGATPVEVVRAALAAMELLHTLAFAEELQARDEELPPEAAYAALRAMGQAVEGVVGWLLATDQARRPLGEVVDAYGGALDALRRDLEGFLPAAEKRRFRASVKHYVKAGHDVATAANVAGLEYVPAGMGLVEAARAAGAALEVAATAFFALGDRLALGQLRDALRALPAQGKWEKIAQTGIVMDLRAAQQRLTAAYLRAAREEPRLTVDAFVARQPFAKRYDAAVRELRLPGELSLAGGAVLARLLSLAAAA